MTEKVNSEKNIVGNVAGSQGGFLLNSNCRQDQFVRHTSGCNGREFFQGPNVKEECLVSSNMTKLVDLPFQAAENSM